MAINGLFFIHESMYRKYSNEGELTFVEKLPQLLFTLIGAHIIEVILCFFSMTDVHIYEIKSLPKEEKELLSKSYGQSLKELRELLFKDRQNVESSRLSEEEKRDLLLIISMLANVIESNDIDAIVYAFSAYKFAIRTHRILFYGREKKTQKLVGDVLNGI